MCQVIIANVREDLQIYCIYTLTKRCGFDYLYILQFHAMVLEGCCSEGAQIVGFSGVAKTFFFPRGANSSFYQLKTKRTTLFYLKFNKYKILKSRGVPCSPPANWLSSVYGSKGMA